MTTTNGKRKLWLDAAKGIGIVLVVFGHSADGLFSAGQLARSGAIGTAFFLIYTFHMPLFFFLSGLTIPKSLGRGSTPFLKDKLATIAYPYLIWSLIQGTIQLQVASHLNHGMTIWSLVAIPWSPIGHFWFLYALMVCHLVSALLARRPGVALAVIPLGFIVNSISPSIFGSIIAYHLPFYIAGWLLSSQVMNWNTGIGREALRLIAWLAAAFAVSAAIAAYSLDFQVYYAWVTIPAAVAGTLLVIAVSKTFDLKSSSLIVVLGRCSLAIYVMHIMVVGGTRIILTKSGLVSDPVVVLAVSTVFGLTAPLIALQLLERFGLAEAVGLGRIHQGAKDAKPSLA